MKKIFLFLSAGTALLISTVVFQACHSGGEKENYYGDADGLGTEQDALERLTYEYLMLRDPATNLIPAHARDRELAYAANLPKVIAASAKGTGLSAWLARGPWNVGGRTRAFAMDVSDTSHLVGGSCSGGMWESNDGGSSWSMTSSLTDPLSVSCLAQDTRSGHTNTWYYGSGEAYGASATATGAYYLGNGIYKSTDNGATWAVLPSTTTANINGFDSWADLSWDLAIDPSNTTEDEIYVAAYGGIYRSTDGGTGFTLVKDGGSAYFTDIEVTSTGVAYASISSDGISTAGLYRSTDGLTWTNITPAGFPTVYNRIKIGIAPSDESQVYFLGNTPGFGTPDTNYLGDIEWNSMWKYNYISGDGSGTGGNWRDLSANLPTDGGPFDKFVSQGSYDIVVKVKPDDTNVVFIGGTCLYRSTSGFADNTHTTFIGGYLEGATLPVVDMYLNHHPDQHELVFVPGHPEQMISANDGGIFRCNDNLAPTVAWTSLNNGYLTTMFYTVAIDHATTDDVVIGGAQDNGSWFTNSAITTAPWVTPRGGDGSYCAIADNKAAYYFSIQSGKMMRAKLDAAGNVDSFARIDPIGILKDDYLFINPYVLDPNNNNIMYLVGGKHIWRNNDLSGILYASNWDSISTNWVQLPDSTAEGVITAVSVSKSPANRVYFGTSSKRVYRYDNANSGSPVFSEITSSVPGTIFPTGYVSCIAVDPENADNVMVVFSNYSVYSLYYSSNGGTSWTKAGGNLEAPTLAATIAPSCRWASIIPMVDGSRQYLVGTSTGLYTTDTLMGINTVWTQVSPDLIGNAVVDMIDFRQTDGLVTVATHSHGIYSTHLAGAATVPSVTGHNQSISFSCYPNPFRDVCHINIDLPKSSSVTMIVTDQQGKLVQTIVNGQQLNGKQSFTFNGSNLAAGTYYCTLRSGTITETRKIVLLK